MGDSTTPTAAARGRGQKGDDSQLEGQKEEKEEGRRGSKGK